MKTIEDSLMEKERHCARLLFENRTPTGKFSNCTIKCRNGAFPFIRVPSTYTARLRPPAASVLIETGPNGKIISPYNRFIFPRHRLLFIWYCEIILCFSSSALTWLTVVKKGRHVDCEADTLFCTSLLLVYSIIHCFIPYILSIDGMLHLLHTFNLFSSLFSTWNLPQTQFYKQLISIFRSNNDT